MQLMTDFLICSYVFIQAKLKIKKYRHIQSNSQRLFINCIFNLSDRKYCKSLTSRKKNKAILC